MQGTFRHDWDMRRYPFDRHQLVIPLDESDLSAAVVTFEADVASSFLSPEIRAEFPDWAISDLELRASISEAASTYGLPGAEPVGYAHLDAIVQVARTQLLAFFKLTAGVFAAALIAVLTFFFDPRDRGSFNSKLALLVGVLFAVLINMPFGGRRSGNLFPKLAGREVPKWAVEAGAASWAQFLLRYVVSHPAVTCTIPGTHRVAHLEDNMRAGRSEPPDRAMRTRMEQYWASV